MPNSAPKPVFITVLYDAGGRPANLRIAADRISSYYDLSGDERAWIMFRDGAESMRVETSADQIDDMINYLNDGEVVN